MRILFDLQGVQAPGTRNRGIGRYTMSLIKSVLRQNKTHDIHCLLNGAFPEAIAELYDELSRWISADNFHTFGPITPTGLMYEDNLTRASAAEICREAMIANLKPDLVHITSLFEGLFDNAVLSVGRFMRSCPTTVTLYDLIPLIHREIYLENPDVERWYEHRLADLSRADALLTISDSSAREAIEHLCFPVSRVANITTDADPQFENSAISASARKDLLGRLGISKDFVMYTGGIDWRKNIEKLIAAYAKLPVRLRKVHQLVIVCAITEEQRNHLMQEISTAGMTKNDVILTGYVADADLIGLYKSCKLFVFPSWHEGFGLPILEAMRCGAPVIGGNLSSIPEVIGFPDALFDPHDENAIRDAIQKGLADENFRSELIAHGQIHAQSFSWEKAGALALESLEATLPLARPTFIEAALPTSIRKRLAFISPIQPAQSGIADYSADLLPQLCRHYEVEIIVKDQESADAIDDEFIRSSLVVRTMRDLLENPSRYDRVLYQIGNSDHHNHMYHAIEDVPGVVVLHDFFLSGMISFEQYHYQRGDVWFDASYESHGYSSLAYQHFQSDLHAAVTKYPANKRVVDNAIGVIVHSKHSVELADKWLGKDASKDWQIIPLLRKPVSKLGKLEARERLGIGADEFVVSSFGFVNPTKQSRRILDAWLSTPIAGDKNARLLFVGANHPGEYGKEMEVRIAETRSESSISIVGWADQAAFRDYLDASDAAVQLRMLSRGETSAAVLDAMNYGLATIVNAHGSMATLPKCAVHMLPDEFTDEQLREALLRIYEDPLFRETLSRNARAVIEKDHNPRNCGDAYYQAIEGAYRKPRITKAAIIQKLPVSVSDCSTKDIAQISRAIEVATSQLSPVSYLSVSSQMSEAKDSYSDPAFAKMMSKVFSRDIPRRLEPIYFDEGIGLWRYARTATLNAIGMPVASLNDATVDVAATADLIVMDGDEPAASLPVVRTWRLLPRNTPTNRATKSTHPLQETFRREGYELELIPSCVIKEKR